MTVWIVASIPFWTLAAGLLICAFAAAAAAASDKVSPGPQFVRIMFVAAVLTLCSGLMAFVAAKLCS